MKGLLLSILLLTAAGTTSAAVNTATLPCIKATNISAPSAEGVGSFDCVQKSEEGKEYTMVFFSQVYCGACKYLVAKMPEISDRLSANTTVRVVVLDRYSEVTQTYANQEALKQVFVANDKSGTVSFGREFGVRYTPSLILFAKNGEELYRAPLRTERRGANDEDINRVAEITHNQ
ncbi:MAG: thioredoxin family protein [Oligoflexia bacterium]|nr:thioredoxin family protein [Oligoflexia bacterium]MBF0365460.1 thioredoxin family protein [Oligoflexia bacterium]